MKKFGRWIAREFDEIALADAAESSDHLVSPEDAVRMAMARQ